MLRLKNASRSALILLSVSAVGPVASAAVIVAPPVNQTADFTVDASDLLEGAVATPPAAASHEGSSAVYSTLVDGAFGTKGDKTTSVTPNNNDVVLFTLAATAPSIKQILTYAGWPDGGRDDQRYTVAYSTAAAPATFIDIATVNNAATGNSAANSAQKQVIFDDTGADLASNVAALRFTFTNNQENGYVGYREFDASPTAFTPEPTALGAVVIGAFSLFARRQRGNT